MARRVSWVFLEDFQQKGGLLATFPHPPWGLQRIALLRTPLAGFLVVIAGLRAESTLRAVPLLLSHGRQAGNVLVLPHGGPPRGLVVPSRELTINFVVF